ncbi:MAG: NADH-quinone oxidoreductase subunit NuoH [Planctomycetota bacterium]|jgi:NADH-quinone oxidoreductase subunit H
METLIGFFEAQLGVTGVLALSLAYATCIGSLLGFITVYAMFAIWMERKVAAHMQVRYGPMETGAWHGWAQSLADALKLLFKEDLIPSGANKVMFWIAPAIVFCGVFAGFIAIPFAVGVQIVDIHLGLFFIIAIAAVEVVGVIMAGWASNSKYSLFGAVREAAQVVSYEVPAAVALMVPVVVVGSFQLGAFNAWQEEHGWLVFHNPFLAIAALIYFISSLAGCKRAPFDLPEAESELVSGFHTEYSGMRFSFFFLEEYASMFVAAALTATLFFGGWTLPFVDVSSMPIPVGIVVLLAKIFLFIFVQMWLRWTLPRLRVDQVMSMGYKYLLPWGFFAVVGTAVFETYGWRWLPF